MRITPLALAASLLASGGMASGDDTLPASAPRPAAVVLEPSTGLQPLPRGEAARRLPIVLQADSIRSQPDLATVAEGRVEFRRGELLINADRLSYDTPQDLASARGHVRVVRDGAVYSGPELELRVQRFEGFFLEPEYEFTQIGAGGRADRIDFLGPTRSRATNASYTSCPRGGPEEPDWVLRARSVRLDFDANEGIAEGAVLRFLGTPIVALPILSFPLTDARKSGWLPPSVNIDNRSGVELAVPYYWNIAPNRDATIVPRIITRRGLGLDTEFRYLEPAYQGNVLLEWLPQDRIAGRSREALSWAHLGQLRGGLVYRADLARVSDDDWWKDFPNAGRSFTPRLLPLRLALERPFEMPTGEGEAYLRTLRWQVLQAPDSFIAAPYERSAQLGVRLGGGTSGWRYAMETEVNRYTLPHGQAASSGRYTGDRAHLVANLSRPLREPGWWLVPRLSVNAASYFKGNEPAPAVAVVQQGSRVIPTFSIDAGLELERDTSFFGRALQQTLEPRLLYVNTPYRAQSQFPNYDSAARDFSFVSIYAANAFSGVDRVSDAHQLTAGVTTRLVDTASGAEAFNLTLVQRYLFRPQRVAPQADGTPDGEPLTQRFSDLLLVGSTSVLPGWALDATVQYSPDLQRAVRSIVAARWSPGPYRTLSSTYRLARGLSEQLELGWQWPVYRSAGKGRGACSGSLYSVGRVNYSLNDSRITDAVFGVEYDAGCWIGRLVAERLSTGRSEATTRLLVQLELVGLSRIGSNPLKVLKDNIPGYRLLRDDSRGAAPLEDRQTVFP
ncbi:MAG: LPS assembly protein LptD [Rubrivivax sp.]|nr:LPS assembly protein LptD [Rubrivivax sp.]